MIVLHWSKQISRNCTHLLPKTRSTHTVKFFFSLTTVYRFGVDPSEIYDVTRNPRISPFCHVNFTLSNPRRFHSSRPREELGKSVTEGAKLVCLAYLSISLPKPFSQVGNTYVFYSNARRFHSSRREICV